MQEQELLQSYEVKNWDFSPRIYKILAVSAIFNILALLIVGQTNLLTVKGCDSPLVGKVCYVIDTLYAGGTILTTDSEYVSKDYEPTELSENDEIIFVNVADRLYYPEGYFAQSNPELAQLKPDGTFPADVNDFQNIPGIPNSTVNGGGGLFNKTPELPKVNDNPVDGNIADSPYSVGGTNPTTNFPKYSTKKQRKNPTIPKTSPTTLPELTPDTTADKETKDQTPVKNEAVSEVEINKKVMKDFALNVKAKYEKKEIDLSQNFKVIADGVLTADGKLDTTIDKKTKLPKTRILKTEGNEEMVEVAKQAIAAIGDSGWLVYLRTQGIEKINFTVVQDNDNLTVVITSDQPTPERAKTITSGLGGIIQGALLLDKNNLKKLGDDERVLLSSAQTSFNGNQFVLNFVLPKTMALEMITRKLNEPEKQEETKPQSTAQVTDGNKKSS